MRFTIATVWYKILEGENFGELQEIRQNFLAQNFLSHLAKIFSLQNFVSYGMSHCNYAVWQGHRNHPGLSNHGQTIFYLAS